MERAAGRRPYDRLMLQFRAARDVEDAVPYGDGGEDAALFVGADGDEIGAGGGVIIIRQADLFPFGQVHGTTSVLL